MRLCTIIDMTGDEMRAMGASEDSIVKGFTDFDKKGNATVYINRESPQAWQAVVGHETMHLIKKSNPQAYKELADSLEKYVKDIGDYDELEAFMRRNYPELQGNDPKNMADFREEMVSEMLGRYVFGEDDKFIKRLAGENPTALEKMVDYIKNLIREIKNPELADQFNTFIKSAEDAIGAINKDEVAKNAKGAEGKAAKGVKEHRAPKQIERVKELERLCKDNDELFLRVLADSRGIESRAVKKLNTTRLYELNDAERAVFLRELDGVVGEGSFEYAIKNSLFVDKTDYGRIKAEVNRQRGASDGITQHLVSFPDGEFVCFYDGNRLAIIDINRGGNSAVTRTQRNNIKYGSRSRNERSLNGENDSEAKLSREDGENGGSDKAETAEARSDAIRDVTGSGIGKIKGKYSKEKPANAGSFNAHRDELLSDAEESYGAKYTEDFNETGFIFPDGKLPKMGDYGQRAEDHNVVIGLYDDIGYDTHQAPKSAAMGRFNFENSHTNTHILGGFSVGVNFFAENKKC